MNDLLQVIELDEFWWFDDSTKERVRVRENIYWYGRIDFLYLRFTPKGVITKTFNTYDEVREYWENEYNKAQNKEETIETKIKPITGKKEIENE